MSDPYELARAVHESMIDLRRYNRLPVLVRMHPLDIETMRARWTPDADPFQIHSVAIFGVPVEPDENVGRGAPVAEFDAAAEVPPDEQEQT